MTMKCTFCGDEIERGTGKVKYMKDGRIVNLCSMKCEKNLFKLGRVARETPWTAEYKAAKLVRLGLLKDGNQIGKKKAKTESSAKAEAPKKAAKSSKKE